MKKLKEISFAYPSSPLSERIGTFTKMGCYAVCYFTHGKSYKTFKYEILKGFKTLEEARSFADTLPEPYSNYSL